MCLFLRLQNLYDNRLRISYKKYRAENDYTLFYHIGFNAM